MLTRDSGSCSVGATHHVMKAPYLLAARRIQLGASDLGGIAVARKTFRLLAAFPAARSNWARRSSVVIGRGGAPLVIYLVKDTRPDEIPALASQFGCDILGPPAV